MTHSALATPLSIARYVRCWPALDLRTPTAAQHRQHLDYSLDKEKANARICLFEYRRTRQAFYLWQAIFCTQSALRLARLLAADGMEGAQS